MTIDAYIDNPVIATQEDYYALEELIHEIEPDCEKNTTLAGGYYYSDLARRTFKYTRNPSIEGGREAAVQSY